MYFIAKKKCPSIFAHATQRPELYAIVSDNFAKSSEIIYGNLTGHKRFCRNETKGQKSIPLTKPKAYF